MNAVCHESQDEDDLIKDVLGPKLRYDFIGALTPGVKVISVYDEEGRFLGTLKNENERWWVLFVKKRQMHTHFPVESKEDGGYTLWLDYIGDFEIPEISTPAPAEGSSVKESLQNKAKLLVSALSETEDEDDPKEIGYDQLDVIVIALKNAGYTVINAGRMDEKLFIIFSWPAENTVAYVNGWKRAREIMKPYMQIRQDNFRIVQQGIGPDKTAIVTVMKKIEEDPNLWKLEPNIGSEASDFFTVLFNGQKVGRFYIQMFNGASDEAEKIREEMSVLNQIVPFDPSKWTAPGNGWGRGPALDWWRKNRDKLPQKYHVAKDLYGIPNGA